MLPRYGSSLASEGLDIVAECSFGGYSGTGCVNNHSQLCYVAPDLFQLLLDVVLLLSMLLRLAVSLNLVLP